MKATKKTERQMTDEDLDGSGLDPEVLQELTDEEARELAEKTKREIEFRAHYHDDIFNLLDDLFKPNQGGKK